MKQKITMAAFQYFEPRSISWLRTWFVMALATFAAMIPVRAQYKQQNYSVVHAHTGQQKVTGGNTFQMAASIGQYVTSAGASTANNSIAVGLWSFYLMRPFAPYVAASQGDFPDRVEISWKFDPVSPPANMDYFKIYRDNILLTSLPAGDSFYKDYNVQPGNYYSYTVSGVNKFGESPLGLAVGFVNPNGTITGRITTRAGNPVNDVEVLITPNLGKSLKFNGINTYVDAGNQLSLKDTSFTIEFWMKFDAVSSGYILTQNFWGGASADSQLHIGIASGTNRLYVRQNATTTTTTFTPNTQWRHYAWVFNKSTQQSIIYVDSQKIATFTSAPYKGIGQLILGKGYGNSGFSAMYLDEMRIWLTAKDSASIMRNMHRTVNSQSPGLAAYWKMDEGKGTRIFDYASKKHTGLVNGAVSYPDDRSPIRNTAFTGTDGYYIAEGINYGTSTNFTVYPSRPGRQFIPENRLVTLSTSNTAVNNIDFTDISQIPVSGYITHLNQTCLNDTTVELLVNDSVWTPRTFANAEGEYLLEFPPGWSGTIKPSRPGYVFNPSFIRIDSIVQPQAGRNFIQNTRYALTVTVAGSKKEIPLNGQTKVKVTSLPACVKDSLTLTSNKTFTFPALPPLRYLIEVSRTDGITFESDTVDLSNGTRSKKFIYRSPLLAGIDTAALPTLGACIPPKVILQQLQKYRVNYFAYEKYNNNNNDTCRVDSVWFFVVNEIADDSQQDTLISFSGVAADSFYAGYPNILAGGAHPYQKRLFVQVADRLNRQATVEFWGAVTGVKPRGGQTFVSHSPEIPLMILRDPPGDQSFSYLTRYQNFYTSLTNSVMKENGTERNYYISLAPYFESSSGFGFSIITNITPIAQTFGVLNTSHRNTTTNQLAVTSTLTEQIATGGLLVQGKKNDIFMGVAYNIIYGLVDSLRFNPATCQFTQASGVIMSPDSIESKFIYNEDYIRTVKIPTLYSLNNPRDSLYARNWTRMLAYNDSLKRVQTDSLYNVSFSGGATYTYTRATEVSQSFTVFDEMPSDSAFGFIAGVFFTGLGGQGGGTWKFGYNVGVETVNSSSVINEVSYTLADDDLGDAYTVNIAQDSVFGTPVFRTIAGRSSCPHEEGTIVRDSAVLSPKLLSAVNLMPDSIAAFPLFLGNASATQEVRQYKLRVLNETNPHGAVIAINGAIIEDGLVYTLPVGLVQTTVTVKRGPLVYEHNNIKLVLEPLCGDEELADTVAINLRFLKPCSPIAISSPGNNWLINSASRDTMMVSINGYNNANASFTAVKLQIRPRELMGPSLAFTGSETKETQSALKSINLTGYPILPLPGGRQKGDNELISSDSYDASTESRYQLYASLYPEVIRTKNSAFLTHATALTSAEDEGTMEILPEHPMGNWFTFKTIPRDSLLQGSTTVHFVASGLDDGQYELRAITVCDGSSIEGSSALVWGTINRTGPYVLGLPEPVSGILTLQDQISIRFSESIQCGSANQNNVKVFDVLSGGELNINVTCDGTNLVITPDVANRFIENKILRTVVKKITDIHGNPMRVQVGTIYRDSLAWEFVVQKSPVRWASGDIQLVKYTDETVQVSRELINRSGFANSYFIRNIPNWMTVSSVSGVVPGQGSVPITFTLGTEVPYGTTEVTVVDSTVYGDQPLRIKIVNACRPPNWTVNSSAYQYSMNIVAKLVIDTIAATDINDRVSVFVGNECRGVALVSQLAPSTFRVFITVYSNELNGENLQFRVWDSSGCREYGQILEQFAFSANSVLGTISNPVTLTATSQRAQQYRLNNGWSWISFNMLTQNMSVSNVLQNLNPVGGDIIKEQGPYAQYVSNGIWFGTLDTIRLTKMYLLRLTKKDSLVRTGYPVEPQNYPIRLDSGWNYIGYTPSGAMPVGQALQTVNASEGDIIKGQSAFSMYDPLYGWFGDLFQLKPQAGYLLRVSRKDTLIYPAAAPSAPAPLASNEELIKNVENHPEWMVTIPNYQYSMSLVVSLGTGIMDSLTENTILGVFSGNECRGFATPLYLEGQQRHLFFLTVYGNSVSGDSLQFRVFDPLTNRTIALLSRLRFAADRVEGKINEPFILTGTPLEVKDGRVIPARYELSQNYPNPFNPSTTIAYALPEDGMVQLAVYNIMGELVRSLVSEEKRAGYYSVQWDGRNNAGMLVPSGIYLYSIRTGNFNVTKKLTLIK